MSRKVVQVLIALLVLAGAAGVASWIVTNRPRPVAEDRETPRPLVRAVTVSRERVEIRIDSYGTVRPRTATSLIPEVVGRVVSVSPSWGDGGFFEEGDVLLRIDPVEYELGRTMAAEQVARAELRLAQAEEEAALAREEWNERPDPGEPTPLVLHEPQLADARATLDAAKARLEKATLDLAKTDVRAPFAGRIAQILVDVGQYLAPGTPAARIYSIEYAEVRLPVPDADLAFLTVPFGYRGESASDGTAEGPTVDLIAQFAGRERTWPARVVRTEGEIDPQSRMVHVVARVDDPYRRRGESGDPPLPVGLFVRARIHGDPIEDVVVLPRQAVRDEGTVLVIDDQLRLHSRAVEVIRFDGERAILRGRSTPEGPGLDAGERVSISPLTVVVEGMGVELAEAAPPERPESAESGPVTEASRP